MSLYCTAQTDPATAALDLSLRGHWSVLSLPAIRREIGAIPLDGIKKITLKGNALEDFDTSAAWYLSDLLAGLQARGIKAVMTGFKDNHRRIFDRISAFRPEKEELPQKIHPARALLIATGRNFVDIWKDCIRGTGFLGEFLAGVPLRFLQPKRFRFRSIVFHINEVGIKAVPIIALMAFSIAFVTGYQGAFQLQKFDATVYTVDLIVLSTLREMGVLITAIMLAGRSGSAFAAQIGTMKLNEEVDALQTMGVSPFEALVLPRIIAILIALPLLTVIANIMGLLGGYIFSYSYLDYSYVQFLSRMQEAADMRQFYVGLSKAPVFALLIGIVGCMQGLQARGSAEDVGRKTITAVVQSIFLVIVADALFSVIFTKLGI
jgi:phospholipid/cholesterol/gamma-HCH transport system permease protein